MKTLTSHAQNVEKDENPEDNSNGNNLHGNNGGLPCHVCAVESDKFTHPQVTLSSKLTSSCVQTKVSVRAFAIVSSLFLKFVISIEEEVASA